MHEGEGDGSEALASNIKISSSKKNPSERTSIQKQRQQDKIVAQGGHF